MATLSENMKNMRGTLEKYAQILEQQTTERVHALAIEHIRIRKTNPAGAETLAQRFDDADAAANWTLKLQKLLSEIPEIREESVVSDIQAFSLKNQVPPK